MPTTPHQEDSMAHKPPSPRQLTYLKALAKRTGQTFTYPHTSAEASAQIRRLKAVKTIGFTFAELEAEQAARQANDDVPVMLGASIRPHEIAGWNSTATWSRRP